VDAQAWDARYAGAELVWKAEPNQFVADATARLKPGRALDLACGEGRNAVWLAALGWAVVGVDFSAVALDKARSLAAKAGVGVDVTWVRADVVTWQPEPGAFDVVLLSYLHLPREQRREVLAAATRALAELGVLVIVGHDRANLADGFGGPQDPSILLDAEELLDDLAQFVDPAAVDGVELRVERAGRVTRRVVHDGAEHTAVDTLVVATRRR
jgi:SAM-dependent methyltransferase